MKMYTYIVNIKTAQWKVKGYITKCTPGKSAKKKVERGWTPN